MQKFLCTQSFNQIIKYLKCIRSISTTYSYSCYIQSKWSFVPRPHLSAKLSLNQIHYYKRLDSDLFGIISLTGYFVLPIGHTDIVAKLLWFQAARGQTDFNCLWKPFICIDGPWTSSHPGTSELRNLTPMDFKQKHWLEVKIPLIWRRINADTCHVP